MGTLHIGNSYSVATDFEPEIMGLIEKALTYTNEEAFLEIKNLRYQFQSAIRYKQYGRVKFMKERIAFLETQLHVCLMRQGTFPTGLLSKVIETLDMARISREIQDYRTRPAKRHDFAYKNTPLTPRYHQDAMLKIARLKHRGVFEACVGSGKSLVMELIIKEMGVTTLIIVPSADLGTQIYDTLVGSFGKSKVENLKADTVRKAGERKPIRIMTIQSISSLKKSGELGLLLDGVKMVCIDEVHHAGSDSFLNILGDMEDVYYRFGFSGTFLRNDSKTLAMWSFLSDVLYRYPAAKAVEDKFLTPITAKIHTLEGQGGGNYQKEYTKNYCENPILLSQIRRIISEIPADKQILILVARKDTAGKIIAGYLELHGIMNTYVDGDSKKDSVKEALRAFNAHETRILIGSSVLGEGIDIRTTDHLIMAQGGKSEIAITQAVGRAVRLSPGKRRAYVHDFVFKNTSYLEDHAAIRLDIYRENFAADVEEC